MESSTSTTPKTRRKPGQHLPGLDGLRGLAIMVVMFHHLLPKHYPAGIPEGIPGIIIKSCYRFFDVGWWGVDLFFVLSGFLITGILLEAKGSANYFGNFYARRSLRIFPLYYGVLALFFFVLPWLANMPATADGTHRYAGVFMDMSKEVAPVQGWLWFYGTNVKLALAQDYVFGIFHHFWSLAVEEHFYFIWPLVVYFCSTRTLARLCLVVAVASLLCRAGFYYGGLKPDYIYALSPCRFDGLALGALVASLTQIWRNSEVAGAPRAPAEAPGFLASIRILLLIDPPPHATLDLLKDAATKIFIRLLPIAVLSILILPRFGALIIILGHTLLSCMFAAALPAAAAAENTGRLFSGRWLYNPALQLFGKLSYGLYVFHPFIQEPVENLLKMSWAVTLTGGTYAGTAILRYILAFSIALVVATLSWHLFEKRILKLKRFFPSKSIRPITPDLTPAALSTVK